eukprot:scaffold200694_cov31-Tisochrysis_lutea.AAC.2
MGREANAKGAAEWVPGMCKLRNGCSKSAVVIRSKTADVLPLNITDSCQLPPLLERLPTSRPSHRRRGTTAAAASGGISNKGASWLAGGKWKRTRSSVCSSADAVETCDCSACATGCTAAWTALETPATSAPASPPAVAFSWGRSTTFTTPAWVWPQPAMPRG